MYMYISTVIANKLCLASRNLPCGFRVSTLHVHVLMRDEKEGRKKQARSNKQQGKATQHTVHINGYLSFFLVVSLTTAGFRTCSQVNIAELDPTLRSCWVVLCIMNIIRVIMYHYWGNFGVYLSFSNHQMGPGYRAAGSDRTEPGRWSIVDYVVVPHDNVYTPTCTCSLLCLLTNISLDCILHDCLLSSVILGFKEICELHSYLICTIIYMYVHVYIHTCA